ncbi:MAG: serine hydrolase [Reichenbachiella sp.]|uniref:serine hydrolase domain-containing protein n=1 Tax=Reichenbachiella sp. TaxID=2184521 RepID=UPI0032649121
MNYSAWALEFTPNPMDGDSLYAQWSKDKTRLPTLLYQIEDFNDFADRIEAESLIRTYGIGGIVLQDGNHLDVKRWIEKNQALGSSPLLYITKMSSIFELPFDELDFPTKSIVECQRDTAKTHELGRIHATVLRSMGVALVQLPAFPRHYTSDDLQKVLSYLNGLKIGNVSFFFQDQLWQDFLDRSGLVSTDQISLLHVEGVASGGLLDKKSLKKYRKLTEDKRLVIDKVRQEELSLIQIERGVDLTVLSGHAKSQSLINSLLLENMLAKGYFKRSVKEYFGLLRFVQSQLRLPIEEQVLPVELRDDFEKSAITLVADDYQLIPIQHLQNRKLYTLSADNNIFQSRVDRYQSAQHFSLAILDLPTDSLVDVFPADALVLIDLTSIEDDEMFERIKSQCVALNRSRSLILFYGGNANFIKNRDELPALMWTVRSPKDHLGMMVEMAFGVHTIEGVLPGYFDKSAVNRGHTRNAIGRISYERERFSLVDTTCLNSIDTLVASAIRKGMIPGCQILMIKDGKVLYDKNFGYLTYDSITPVEWNHMYDIASVTKTVATVPALMDRMQEGSLSLASRLGDYLTAYRSTDKSELTVNDLLIHKSGLKSYIPFWRYAKYDADSATFLYKKRKRTHNYLSVDWSDSIQSWIGRSQYNSLSNEDGTYRYLYSDLGFMAMKDLVEEHCSCPLDQSIQEQVYGPMGMDHTSFNPLEKFQKNQIAPTERDRSFRSTLLQGVVHDKNAALLDGVSGHAGLFSNANDLAKYMQMMIQNGYYGGVQYFSDSLIKVFTSKNNEKDRRALGWDKPNRSVGNSSIYASDESYGHSGFTGTLVWADPKYNLIYIFLSNRIYPDPQNYKLIESNTRTKIHDLMYKSFLKLGDQPNDGS